MNPIQYTCVFHGVVLVRVPVTPPKSEVPPPAAAQPSAARPPAAAKTALDTVA